MGGGGQPSSTSSTSKVTTTNVPEYLQPYLTDVASKAQAESQTPYQAYGGQRNASFTADQQAAMGDIRGMESPEQFAQASNMYGNMAGMGASAAMQGLGGAGIAQGMGMGQAAMGAGRAFGSADALGQRGQSAVDQGMQRAFADSTPQAFGADQAQQYTNPFQQNVTDTALRKAREEATRQGNLANLSAAGRGTAGGTRQAVMDSMRNRDTATGLSDIQMQGSMRGYENAQQQFERDQGRRMGSAKLGATMAGQGFGAMGQAGGQYGSLTGQGYSAAGQANQLLGQTGMQGLGTGAAGLSAVGTAEQNANLARLGAQNRVGSQMQDQDKKVIDADIAQYYEKLGYNKDQISWFINQMKTAPVQLSSQTNSGYGRPTSFGQQATGLAAAGIGAFT
jgi:hypothetical protein